MAGTGKLSASEGLLLLTGAFLGVAALHLEDGSRLEPRVVASEQRLGVCYSPFHSSLYPNNIPTLFDTVSLLVRGRPECTR
jgi:hypothetical protein